MGADIRSLGKTALLTSLTTTLRILAKRWLALGAEIKLLDCQLEHLTKAHAPSLRNEFGVGAQTAAVLVCVAGDNPERLKSEAALAALCGVSPLQASSGKTKRHRLNRGGDRAANNALWTIAMVRMRSDPRTQAYVSRRSSQGMSRKEIQRCLKRYIVRELYPLILADFLRVSLQPVAVVSRFDRRFGVGRRVARRPQQQAQARVRARRIRPLANQRYPRRRSKSSELKELRHRHRQLLRKLLSKFSES
jgi:hypothetical protein